MCNWQHRGPRGEIPYLRHRRVLQDAARDGQQHVEVHNDDVRKEFRRRATPCKLHTLGGYGLLVLMISGNPDGNLCI